jgi:hypothetical protein
VGVADVGEPAEGFLFELVFGHGFPAGLSSDGAGAARIPSQVDWGFPVGVTASVGSPGPFAFWGGFMRQPPGRRDRLARVGLRSLVFSPDCSFWLSLDPDVLILPFSDQRRGNRSAGC